MFSGSLKSCGQKRTTILFRIWNGVCRESSEIRSVRHRKPSRTAISRLILSNSKCSQRSMFESHSQVEATKRGRPRKTEQKKERETQSDGRKYNSKNIYVSRFAHIIQLIKMALEYECVHKCIYQHTCKRNKMKKKTTNTSSTYCCCYQRIQRMILLYEHDGLCAPLHCCQTCINLQLPHFMLLNEFGKIPLVLYFFYFIFLFCLVFNCQTLTETYKRK